MRDKDKNRDPERAKKRAVTDLRCAVRKLGIPDAIDAIAALLPDTACAASDLRLIAEQERRNRAEGAA